MNQPFLELQELSKSFGATPVLRGLSVTAAEGEILALLGPSGSGKTTALRLVAGFESPDRGRVTVGGDDVTSLRPAVRGFGMVFQHYALFPHLSVAENVAFGLHGQPRDTILRRVEEMLALVDLTGFGARRVSEISGGQQQRVALARALAPAPRVLLLDEPLSNLDPTLRERTRRELRTAVRKVGITTVLVTHEQEEAFHVADRVAVLHEGHLEQVGRPEELYRTPATRFVANFVGRASILVGTLVGLKSGGTPSGVAQVLLDAYGREGVRWPGRPSASLNVDLDPDNSQQTGARVDIVVRPESLVLTDADRPGALPGTFVERRFTGVMTYGTVRLAVDGAGGIEVEVLLDAPATAEPGAVVGVTLRPGAPPPHVFLRDA
jgi:ABC-type Fe3+/spermidine/putrescine transport system ATPase subunit